MSTNNWSKVVVVGDNGLADREATIAALDTYLDALVQDQEEMATAIDNVFRGQTGSKAVVADTVLSLAAVSLTTDADRFSLLKEIGASILKANYAVAKGQNGGTVNPHYVEPKKQ